MRFQTDLIPGTLIRRYKRFLSDVHLADGTEVVAHCPNPGAMTGLAEPGTTVWLEPNDDPKKKLKYGWRLTQLDAENFACIDTSIANRVVAEALSNGSFPEFAAYKSIRPEVKYGDNSRVDFLLQQDGLQDVFLEVKSVTLSRQHNVAEFPDTVTKRGAKHLYELAKIARSGHRAVMLSLIQRTDCQNLSVASDIDPDFAIATQAARDAGVEFITGYASISVSEVSLSGTSSVAGLYDKSI